MKTIKINLKPIRKIDIQWLNKSYIKNNLSEYASRFTPHRYAKLNEIKSKLHKWIGIHINNTLIGSYWIEKKSNNVKTGKLGILIHTRKYWSRGIGTNIISNAVPTLAESMAIKTIILNVRYENKRALQCYHKCGYKIMKMDSKAINGKSIKLCKMLKKLKAAPLKRGKHFTQL